MAEKKILSSLKLPNAFMSNFSAFTISAAEDDVSSISLSYTDADSIS